MIKFSLKLNDLNKYVWCVYVLCMHMHVYRQSLWGEARRQWSTFFHHCPPYCLWWDPSANLKLNHWLDFLDSNPPRSCVSAFPDLGLPKLGSSWLCGKHSTNSDTSPALPLVNQSTETHWFHCELFPPLFSQTCTSNVQRGHSESNYPSITLWILIHMSIIYVMFFISQSNCTHINSEIFIYTP